MDETKYVVRIGGGGRYIQNSDRFAFTLEEAAKHDSASEALNSLAVMCQKHGNITDFGRPVIVKVRKQGWKEVGDVI